MTQMLTSTAMAVALAFSGAAMASVPDYVTPESGRDTIYDPTPNLEVAGHGGESKWRLINDPSTMDDGIAVAPVEEDGPDLPPWVVTELNAEAAVETARLYPWPDPSPADEFPPFEVALDWNIEVTADEEGGVTGTVSIGGSI